MIACSIVAKRDFHNGLIFDPEHYHPARLSALSTLQAQSVYKLGDFFTEISELVAPGVNIHDEKVFDLPDAISWLLDMGDCPANIGSAKKRARPNDLIISRLRSYLKEICIVPTRGEFFSPLISTEFVVLRSKKTNECTSWLLPYLLCDAVQTILFWSQTGSNHPRFANSTIFDLPIPNSILSLKDELSSIVKSAIDVYENAKSLYPDAEKEILERLDWHSSIDKSVVYYVEKKSQMDFAGRIDTEHFQPKYKMIREHLQSKGAIPVKCLRRSINRGVQPRFVTDGTIDVIASKAIRPYGIDIGEEARTDESFWLDPTNEKSRVYAGDVLLNSTGVSTLGRASFYINDKNAIADNHVTIIRTNNHICSPLYLSLFLNSPIGIAQSEMYQTGSSGQLEIYPHQIDDILVYIPKNTDGNIDLEWQKKISDMILNAYTAKQTAQIKLFEAKKLVDKAIAKYA